MSKYRSGDSYRYLRRDSFNNGEGNALSLAISDGTWNPPKRNSRTLSLVTQPEKGHSVWNTPVIHGLEPNRPIGSVHPPQPSCLPLKSAYRHPGRPPYPYVQGTTTTGIRLCRWRSWDARCAPSDSRKVSQPDDGFGKSTRLGTMARGGYFIQYVLKILFLQDLKQS
jgi:hypothetical protein